MNVEPEMEVIVRKKWEDVAEKYPDAAALIRQGYRRVSTRYGVVARIDRPDWQQFLLNQGYQFNPNILLGRDGGASHYRVMHTQDTIEGVPREIYKLIPHSHDSPVGYILPDGTPHPGYDVVLEGAPMIRQDVKPTLTNDPSVIHKDEASAHCPGGGRAMTVDELKKVVDEAVAAGHGSADVVFDAEARTFRIHYVAIDGGAALEDGAESGLRPVLVLTTRYHKYEFTDDAE